MLLLNMSHGVSWYNLQSPILSFFRSDLIAPHQVYLWLTRFSLWVCHRRPALPWNRTAANYQLSLVSVAPIVSCSMITIPTIKLQPSLRNSYNPLSMPYCTPYNPSDLFPARPFYNFGGMSRLSVCLFLSLRIRLITNL